MENIVKQGENTVKAHLEHLKDHNQDEFLQQAVDYLKEHNMKVPINEPNPHEHHHEHSIPCGCPGSAMRDMRTENTSAERSEPAAKLESRLQQWPVQLTLVPPNAPYFQNSDLLIAADCVPFFS
jgi:hypothetical protein